MPGAPPVKVVSVAVISTTPFSEKESAEPIALRVKSVPAAKGPETLKEPSCVNWPSISMYSPNSGLPLFHQ